ncbi:MAG: VWA domain-containing protein [Deltaproteobacteria bacterium]|nr:VWA domain-containing protein [Deltaproteobacteria bacterium]
MMKQLRRLVVAPFGDGSIPRTEAGVPLYEGGVGLWDGLIRDGEICAEVKVDLSKLEPTVTLLVDQSSSMKEPFGDQLRWFAVYETLMDSQVGVVKRLESQVRFGLTLYTSDGGSTGGVCPRLTKVPPALNNYQSIDDIYGPARWRGDTPTGDSVDAVTEELKRETWAGAKAIVLATDGEPDTCENSSPDSEAEREAARQLSVDAVQRAREAGITVYVISVGDDVGDAHLADLAKAGGGSQAVPFKALDSSQLVAAFDSILAGLIDCRFTLEGEIDPLLAGQGRVSLNGQSLLFGEEWTLVDSKTLEVLGEPCETLLAGGDHQVEAVFPCGAVIN